MEKNILSRTTELAKVICEKYANKEKTAIDATCGKGHDTLWLAERFGRVYAFDVQAKAVEAINSSVKTIITSGDGEGYSGLVGVKEVLDSIDK